jgi:hypothetical protein
MRDYFSDLLRAVQVQGVDTTVTLHALLFSGATDIITGHPTKGWVDSTIDMIIEPVNAPLQVLYTGLHAGLRAKAYVNTAISDGDEVTDSFGNLWVVLSVLPFQVGDIAVYKQCELALTLGSSYSHPLPTPFPTPIGIGVSDGLPLVISLLNNLEVDKLTLLNLGLLNNLEVDEMTVASISTVAAITVT